MYRTRHFLAVTSLMGALGLAAMQAATAQATIPYPNVGTYNATTYSFTAASDGDLIGYYAIGGGWYDDQLGVLVNGVAQGGYGLDNHESTAGSTYDFGPVHAGDSVVFILHNLYLGRDAYSDPSMNVAFDDPGETIGHNHVYSTQYLADPSSPNQTYFGTGVPAGTYVNFEDEAIPETDFDYFNEGFVFPNVVTGGAVPEPGIVSLFAGGFVSFSAFALRRRRASF